MIGRLYGALERFEPSPVVRLNRAVAVSKVAGHEEALKLIELVRERVREKLGIELEAEVRVLGEP